MSGYAGNDDQRRLQRLSDESAEASRTTPGACNVGRMLGYDDPDRIGLDAVIEMAKRHGVVGFRMIPAERIPALEPALGHRGLRLDLWDVFMGDADAIRAACAPLATRGLPDGLHRVRLPTDAEAAEVKAVQALMLGCGVVPFSGAMLVGEVVPSATVVLADREGGIVAAAYTYLPHNRFSPFHDAAWGGLVAVRKDQRGRGIGNLVNAIMALAAVEELGASRLYELVSATNIASRRMVQSAGLVFDPGYRCGVATAGTARFTR